MSSDDSDRVSRRWSQWRFETDLEEYYSRWRRLEATGRPSHGEADFIESFDPPSVLDAGCGMGRVAIELARRGLDVVGVDLDDDLLDFARRSGPSLRWVHADIATMRLDRTFGMVAMPGNVMVFCRPSDRLPIIRNSADHLEPAGLLVAGFQLESADDSITLAGYDEMCADNGFELSERWSTWHRDPYRGNDYAVSVHRHIG
ncbi:MAG: class I SAM-dependent methyltransferase [Ilumatobacteraceae bacterium]